MNKKKDEYHNVGKKNYINFFFSKVTTKVDEIKGRRVWSHRTVICQQ